MNKLCRVLLPISWERVLMDTPKETCSIDYMLSLFELKKHETKCYSYAVRIILSHAFFANTILVIACVIFRMKTSAQNSVNNFIKKTYAAFKIQYITDIATFVHQMKSKQAAKYYPTNRLDVPQYCAESYALTVVLASLQPDGVSAPASSCQCRLRCCIDSNFCRRVCRSARRSRASTCLLALNWRITSSEISKSPQSSSEAWKGTGNENTAVIHQTDKNEHRKKNINESMKYNVNTATAQIVDLICTCKVKNVCLCVSLRTTTILVDLYQIWYMESLHP